ncbi:hypothetical protein HYDPIDRAFT_114102 [Hydnomerulius pinastri MD-312]|uniref:RING-type domain-containing protein n=1 Tax=Hydnomerulius pinastri MD-312 TaxID=994086 RepID=A0A0C9W756_9AGAM|nr:hypothetical protein HYDPIDRAFT_114102 [Hydnomerulius pinastri MD-312]
MPPEIPAPQSPVHVPRATSPSVPTGNTSSADAVTPPPDPSDGITVLTPQTHRTSVSSPLVTLDEQPVASSSATTSAPTTPIASSSSTALAATATATTPTTSTSAKPPSPATDPLSAYTCPICFSPPTNATLTPCGHICCGPCLFTAVKSTLRRNMAVAFDRAPVAQCPVCRAEIPGWDGKGGGVVGLKVQVVYSL